MPFNLSTEEISDIVNALKNSRLTADSEKKESLITSIIKWLKYKEISFEASQKIVSHFGQIFGELERKGGIKNLFECVYKDHSQTDMATTEDQLTALLMELKGNDSALGIVGTLKSLVPRKRLSETEYKIPSYLNNMLYGILSYDGPTVIVCDNEKKQLVKGYIITREDKKGREYRTIRYTDVILAACPTNTIIYDDPLDIEIKYEITWESFMGSFIVGPIVLPEMITILKAKGLVLQLGLLDSALVAIFKAGIESGKAELRRLNAKEPNSNTNMSITHWLKS